MMGHADPQRTLFYQLSLESFVPPEHPLRAIRPLIEDAAIRRACRALYSPIGRPSIPPGRADRARLPPACARSAEWCRRTGGACRLQRARPLLWGGEGPARAAAQGAGAMTAWTICKGILLAVGI